MIKEKVKGITNVCIINILNIDYKMKIIFISFYSKSKRLFNNKILLKILNIKYI